MRTGPVGEREPALHLHVVDLHHALAAALALAASASRSIIDIIGSAGTVHVGR